MELDDWQTNAHIKNKVWSRWWRRCSHALQIDVEAICCDEPRAPHRLLFLDKLFFYSFWRVLYLTYLFSEVGKNKKNGRRVRENTFRWVATNRWDTRNTEEKGNVGSSLVFKPRVCESLERKLHRQGLGHVHLCVHRRKKNVSQSPELFLLFMWHSHKVNNMCDLFLPARFSGSKVNVISLYRDCVVHLFFFLKRKTIITDDSKALENVDLTFFWGGPRVFRGLGSTDDAQLITKVAASQVSPPPPSFESPLALSASLLLPAYRVSVTPGLPSKILCYFGIHHIYRTSVKIWRRGKQCPSRGGPLSISFR